MSVQGADIRIAVVQIECHPAAYISLVMPLEEPFVSDRTTLAILGGFGFAVSGLHTTCLERYVDWQGDRLEAIVTYLLTYDPPPDLIVFPEYSVPWQCLRRLQEVLSGRSTVVLAGTHTMQSTPAAMKVYRKLGVGEKQLSRGTANSGTAVLPVVMGEQTKLIKKATLSPFEHTAITGTQQHRLTLTPITVGSGERRFTILPLVCSDALQAHNVSDSYGAAIVLSYQDKPSHFDSFIDSQIRNHHPIVYCNDGRFGGSGIFTVGDKRHVDWYRAAVRSLPAQEDAFLVMDVSLTATAVQTGTSAPQKPSRLVGLGAFIYADAVGSRKVREGLMEAAGIRDSVARTAYLESLLHSGSALQIQAKRIEHLAEQARRGVDGDDMWQALGWDCQLPCNAIQTLEGSLAQFCHDQLQGNLTSSVESLVPEAAPAIIQFLRECQRISKKAPGAAPPKAATERVGAAVIDREPEANEVVAFLDHRHQKVCQVLGREQIGKTTVVEKGLSQSALAAHTIRMIRVGEQSTAEYLLCQVVLGYETLPIPIPYDIDTLIGKVPSALKRFKLLVIENGQNLFRGDVFRNDELRRVFEVLVAAIRDCECKLLFLSRRTLPEGIVEPSRLKRLSVHGFERGRLPHGVAYLDSQLRRVEITPTEIRDDQKQELVQMLGGHPLALALAADNIYENGIDWVLRELRTEENFWKAYVKHLIRGLDLDDNDQFVLRLLAGCRTPIVREVLQPCLPFSVAPVLRKLIALCLVDVQPDSRIWLSGFFRVYWSFQPLEEEHRRSLHVQAVNWYQQLARNSEDLEALNEAEYHAQLAGIEVERPTGLLDAAFSSAKALFDQQEYHRARQVLDPVLRFRKSRDVLRLSVLIDSRCNDFDRALVKAKDVFSEDPTDTWLLGQIGKAALDVNRTDIAETLLSIARTAHVEDYSLAILEGRMLLRQRRLPEAVRAFERARDETRHDPWPFFHLGRTHLQLGDLAAAESTLEDGLSFYDRVASRNRRVQNAMRGLLAQCYVLHGEERAAELLLSLLDENNQDNPELVRARIMLSLRQEGVQQAAEAYRRLKQTNITRRDDRCQFHLYYGLFLRRTGKLLEASEQFAQAHRASTTNVYVLVQLAEAYHELANNAAKEGSWTSAESVAGGFARQCATAVRRILELHPSNQRAQDLQEDLYQRYTIEC